jgi:uncharacterized protein (DUF2147 family)
MAIGYPSSAPAFEQGGGQMIVTRLAAATLAAALSIAALPSALAQNPGILGLWWTDKDKGRVEIIRCAPPTQGLCGKIVWISEPNDEQGKPQTDKLNKDPKLKGRPIIGMPIFEGWREAGPSKWTGKVYDPEEGDIYDIDIRLEGDELTLKGCFLFICDSNTWVRYRGR